MPSGTALTNLVDTLVNLIGARYVAECLDVRILDIMALGDDSVVQWYPSPPGDEVESVYAELGLVVSKDKQWVSPDSLHFLQNLHAIDRVVGGVSVGVRSIFRTANGMLSYERLRSGWSKYMDTTRWLMQADQSKFDPRFDTLMRWWTSKDKVVQSGMSPDSIFRAAGGAEVINRLSGRQGVEGREVTGESLNSMESVRWVKENLG